MNVLLIGKNGQLGAELKTALEQSQIKFIAYGHDELDIGNYPAIVTTIKKLRPDIVINTSAYHVLADCEMYPEKAFAINAFAIKNLADTCTKQKIKLVNFSTDYVFDGTREKPYTENDPPNPLQAYGLSKRMGEIFCLNANPKNIVIRTCGVYGGLTGSRQKNGNIVLTFLGECTSRKQLEVPSEQTVSPTYAKDLADACVKLLLKKSTYGIYHLINKGHCSWYEFAKEILKIRKSTARIKPVNRNGAYGGVNRPQYSALANIRAKQNGVVLPTWQNGLERYLRSLESL